MFIGRNKELEQIKSIINSDKKSAIMIYGKRRIGKSALVLEAVKNCKCKVLYYECILASIEENLRNIEQKIKDLFNNQYLRFENFTDIFKFLGSINEKIVVIIDEYSYLKSVTSNNYIDSMFQSIIDQMSDNISIIMLGSYVGIMKELLDKENPLFGRFSAIIKVRPFDYLDSSLFYNECEVRQKIEFYSVLGGSPFVCNLVKQTNSLKENIVNLLLSHNGILQFYIENILLSELTKISNANMILSALSNGKRKYTELESSLNMKTNGGLDKQLKNLIETEIIKKVFPINKRNDKKKTFYEISDNLVRFYYLYVYKNSDIIARIGEEAYYDLYIQPTLTNYISHRFEEIAREYFSRLSKQKPSLGIYDIGTYWYDIPSNKQNGEFDCVLQKKDSYDVYEVKYYVKPLSKKEALEELKQVKKISDSMNIDKLGFVCLSGFDFKDNSFELINGENLYQL